MSKYVFTDEMREISGFGGGYEEACRKMVVAGCVWFDEHPEAKLEFSTYKNIFGIVDGDTPDAKALMDCMAAAVPDCTGAMMQATVGHVLFVMRLGWDAYVAESKRRNQ